MEKITSYITNNDVSKLVSPNKNERERVLNLLSILDSGKVSETSYDVFLSHSSADKLAVENIAQNLSETYSLKCWLDKWNLVPGEPWQASIENALVNLEKT